MRREYPRADQDWYSFSTKTMADLSHHRVCGLLNTGFPTMAGSPGLVLRLQLPALYKFRTDSRSCIHDNMDTLCRSHGDLVHSACMSDVPFPHLLSFVCYRAAMAIGRAFNGLSWGPLRWDRTQIRSSLFRTLRQWPFTSHWHVQSTALLSPSEDGGAGSMRRSNTVCTVGMCRPNRLASFRSARVGRGAGSSRAIVEFRKANGPKSFSGSITRIPRSLRLCRSKLCHISPCGKKSAFMWYTTSRALGRILI